MPGLLPTQIADNTVATLRKLSRGQAEQTQKFRAYPMVGTFWMDDTVVKDQRDGTTYTKPVRLRAQNAFRMSGLFDTEPTSRDDTLAEAAIGWRKWSQNSLVFDADEPRFNSGPSQIVNYVEEVRNGAYENTYNELEPRTWFGLDSSSDTLGINGLLYWLSPVTSGSTDPIGGFNGQTSYYKVSGNTTTIGGIDASNANNTNWRNWCGTTDGTFGAATREMLARAIVETNFSSIPEFKTTGDRTARFLIFVNTTHLMEYERDVNLGPDERQGDLRRFNTSLKFRGVQLSNIPFADTLDVAVSSQNPGNNIIGVNTSKLFAFCDKANWMKEGEQRWSFDSPTVFRIPMNGWGNVFCTNRRQAGFRLHPSF